METSSDEPSGRGLLRCIYHLAVGFYHVPPKDMEALKKRHWLFQRQCRDMRVRLGFLKRKSGRYFVLVFEKRERWHWKPYCEIEHIDLPDVLDLIAAANNYLRG